MNWHGKKVLVTGAGGFIGSHLAEELVRRGAEVTAFLRYNGRGDLGMLALADAEARDAMRVVAGDLRDPEAVRGAVRGQDVVFHLGALIAIPYSYIHPVEVAEVNVRGSLNVFCAARDGGVERVVHTSTSEVYGTARTVPIGEEHPLNAQSPYAASKIGADMLANSFHLSFGLPVAIARPFNTYGPRQLARAVIPTIVGQALYGDRVELGALSPTRDFNYVSDTVEGFLVMGSHPDVVGRTFNFASTREIAIGDLARLVLRLVGRDVPVVSRKERMRPGKSEVERLLGDSSLARRVTGWKPRVSLEEGLQRVIEFFRAHPQWASVGGYRT